MKKYNTTTWKKEVTMPSFPKLEKNIHTDVAIIGGGITGVLNAYALMKAGKKVALIEKGTLGDSVTSLTTAFLTQSLDTDSTDFISMFGLEKSKLIAESHGAAIDLIEHIITQEKIACDFTRCSNYMYSTSEKEHDTMVEENEAALQMGIQSELYTKSLEGVFESKEYIEFKNQGKFHPLKFIAGLAEVLKKNGVEIYENSEVNTISEGHIVQTSDASVDAQWVIVATYEPLNQPPGLFFKKGMYVSYVYELEMPTTQLVAGTYEDTFNPYHYFRVDKYKDYDRIIVGGEDHRQDIPVNQEKNLNALKSFVDNTFPEFKDSYKILNYWAGPVLEPIDGLAFIGTHKKDAKILYAMAFSGNGMTYAAISAIMFATIISGKPHPWTEIYDAGRISSMKSLMYKGKDYLQEFFGGAAKNTFTQSHKAEDIKKEQDKDREENNK